MNRFFFVCLIWVPALVGCGATPADHARQGTGAAAQLSSLRRIASSHDWTRFGWDAGRSSVATDETVITAGNVATLRRQQVTLDGTVDASPIYLHGVRVNGGTDVIFFVTP